jgi:hypothetical protein
LRRAITLSALKNMSLFKALTGKGRDGCLHRSTSHEENEARAPFLRFEMGLRLLGDKD